MVQHARTKDEQFLVCLYEEALKTGDLDTIFDRYAIGALIGLQAKAVETICVLLMKTNFIKKEGDVEVSLTPHGLKLVQKIIG